MEHNLDYPAVLKFLKEKNYKRTDREFIEEVLKAKKSEKKKKKKTNQLKKTS